MLVPSLAQVIGSMMGGGGDLSEGLKMMTDFAQSLLEEKSESQESQEGRKQTEEMLAHPLFEAFRNSKNVIGHEQMSEFSPFADG